eukprot:890597-Pleurochrysis_carterae.AAC.1
MASILPLPSDEETVRRPRCPESDSLGHYEKTHHLKFMMQVVTSRRRLYPGMGSDSSSRRYREALDSLVRDRASLSARAYCLRARPSLFLGPYVLGTYRHRQTTEWPTL